ncbi:MAG: glycogen synthase [Myxococcota bacterium]
MFIVMIASECTPVAKVGGLADVVFGLSRELETRGNAVEIILPKYDHMRYDHIWGLCPSYEHLQVPWFNGHIWCTVWFGFVHGRKCFFIDPHSQDQYFNRGRAYGFDDDVLRFAFFTRAALEFMRRADKRPDVIHTHDWQTALTAPLLFEIYAHAGMANQRVCHTIHNFRHQGVTGEYVLDATGLGRPEYFFAADRLRDDNNPFALNLTKGAIVYSNFVTTVSPRHAWEVRTTDQGYGLGHALHLHHDKFGGVLNGLDYEEWNPERDPHIPVRYSAQNFDRKYQNKKALRERFWLADDYKPVFCYIGRLDAQKGVHLIRHGIVHALAHGAQFVLLGTSPDPDIQGEFEAVKAWLNDSPDCHLELRFDAELAHLIYAGSDMMILPSVYEPCGLTQMIALRYGTVPVVRSVGGLADSVFDVDYADLPLEKRNGFVFYQTDNLALESAMDRAIKLWNTDPAKFRELALAGMAYDYSWNAPGNHYLNIYEYIRYK